MKKTLMIGFSLFSVLYGPLGFAQGTSPSNNADEAQRILRARYAAAANPMALTPAITKEKIDQSMKILIEMGLLYKMIGQPTMVATDSGVIVAYGNTLRKYDKDLNVVKEVELGVDADAMQDLASKLADKYSSKIMDMMGGAGGAGSPAFVPASSPANSTSADATKNYDEQREEQIKKEIDQLK